MKTKLKQPTHGFTLLEVLVVVLIVVILAIIAIPFYTANLKKAKFLNVVKAAETFEVPVAQCAQNSGQGSGAASLTGCDSGSTDPAKAMPGAVGAGAVMYVQSVDVTNGIITAKGTTDTFGTQPIYVLSPNLNTANSIITWGATCTPAGDPACPSAVQ